MDLCIEIVAVLITGRMVADFLTLAVAVLYLPIMFANIDIEGSNILEVHDIRVLLFVTIGSFYHKA